MVEKRIIPLNVKPVEEIAFVDESKITPVYGKTYVTGHKSGLFTIRYEFDSRAIYFEQSGNHSKVWSINGSLEDIKAEQRKLENGEVKVVFSTNSGRYERIIHKEKEVKDQLRKDIRKFELWRHGDPKSIEWKFEEVLYIIKTEPWRSKGPGCEKPLQYGESKK